MYNIGRSVPLDRYHASPRQYHETVEPFEYAKGDLLRRVHQRGFVSTGPSLQANRLRRRLRRLVQTEKRNHRPQCLGTIACKTVRDVFAHLFAMSLSKHAGGVVVSHFEWVKNLTHPQLFRLDGKAAEGATKPDNRHSAREDDRQAGSSRYARRIS
ncbi:hypothetical protein BQ8482_960011 [Mesorhizobium delmotii]|uniref:Uncharacterized protein n=1 Tax=Mesorhizobium delmotii TaxID=1631247 RepID=A0A2P9AXX6_9HYPH|nr:hypothetical protein BQ8482_960011 [Mesorhizobium delmotii]